MKRLFLFFSLIFPTVIFSQEPIKFSEVITVDSASKSELFIRGREWFNDNFKSSKDVLQIQDKETGELVGKGFFLVNCTYTLMGKQVTVPAGVYFQVSLWLKDNRYKYEFVNFNVPGSKDMSSIMMNLGTITESNETTLKIPNLPQKRANEVYLSIKNNTIEKAKFLIESLKQKMSLQSKSTDW